MLIGCMFFICSVLTLALNNTFILRRTGQRCIYSNGLNHTCTRVEQSGSLYNFVSAQCKTERILAYRNLSTKPQFIQKYITIFKMKEELGSLCDRSQCFWKNFDKCIGSQYYCKNSDQCIRFQIFFGRIGISALGPNIFGRIGIITLGPNIVWKNFQQQL